MLSTRNIFWLVWVALYAVFFVWYTDLGGALRPGEIEVYSKKLEEAGFQKEQVERLQNFMLADTGKQFFIVNNIKLSSSGLPSRSSDKAMQKYMDYMWPALFSRASHPVFAGNAVFRSLDVTGIEGAEEWDMALIMRYRSRRDMLDIVSNSSFSSSHDFKVLAMDKTIAYPVEINLYLSDPRLLIMIVLLVAGMMIQAFISRR